MNTTHKIFCCNSADTTTYIKDRSISLVITSPPYPMIEMWNECFSSQSKVVDDALNAFNYDEAYEAMHQVLDKIWEDVDRTVIDGGIVCINIGDATKNCNGEFKLFSNHSRIINKFLSMGYDVLPDIHWHKPTNAPNKFMGSGMYPPCAYITYEHEYILVFRKGTNRSFGVKDKDNRHKSAYFWEERNVWFSDLWELKGTTQKMKTSSSRARSAAFPFELAYRLVNMFSVKGDTVYDPFSGTGTVAKASMALCRNSVGVELDKELCEQSIIDLSQQQVALNAVIYNRIQKHCDFIQSQPNEKKEKMYQNQNHRFLVKTRQEIGIEIDIISSVKSDENVVICQYEKADA